MPSFNSIAFGALGLAALAMAVKAPPREGPAPAVYAHIVQPEEIAAQQVAYGRDLIERTSSLVGPDAVEPSMRFSGNGLECGSCHLNGGRQAFGLSLASAARTFPKYIGRENEKRTLAERIDGCMERSMNGRAMPHEGREMQAMLAYLASLVPAAPATALAPVAPATVVAPVAPATVVEESLAPLPLPVAAADPAHGRAVFGTVCAACHGADGLGQRFDAAEAKAAGQRYRFPPLWGPESYNDGAGMARTVTAARFAHANMPAGTTWQSPVLSTGDAYDVMAFVNSQPRPHRVGLEADYPNRLKKPADAGYPPYVGPFPADQHRYGPWGPIDGWVKAQVGG